MNIQNEEVLVRGATIVMLADTLAAHAVGGFKMGVGFSLRKCRDCMATSDQMHEKVYALCLCFLYYVFHYYYSLDRRNLLLELRLTTTIIVLFCVDHYPNLTRSHTVLTTEVL